MISREIIDTYNDSRTDEKNFYDGIIIANWNATIEFLHYGIEKKVSFYDVN